MLKINNLIAIISLLLLFWFTYRRCNYFTSYRVSQEERSVFWEVIVSLVPSKYIDIYIFTYVLFQTVTEIELFHYTVVWMYDKMHSDEQHAMPSHELQGGLILTVEFSKIYFTRLTIPTFHLNNEYRCKKLYVISLYYQQFRTVK
jgi:hypothetical protein